MLRMTCVLAFVCGCSTSAGDFEPGRLGGGSADGFTQAAIVLGTIWYGDRIEVGARPDDIQDLDFTQTDEACFSPEAWRCAHSTRWDATVSQVCRDSVWTTFNIGPQDCGACAAGNFEGCKTNPDAVNVGYEFIGAAGAAVELEFKSEEPSVVVLYGPKRGDSWANAEPYAWARSDDATLGAELPGDGTYLALVRRSDTAKLPSNFSLGLSCTSGLCWPEYDHHEAEYAVAYVRDTSTLNVRSGPSTQDTVIQTLRHDTRGLILSGNTAGVGRDLWVELEDGGWVNRRFIVEDIGNACERTSDFSYVAQNDVLEAFVRSLKGQSSSGLAAVASPIHGIDFSFRNGHIINYDPSQIQSVFEDETSHDWGDYHDGDEAVHRIEGSVKEFLLPIVEGILVDRRSEATFQCNETTLHSFDWTYGEGQYTNLNHFAVSIVPEEEIVIGFEWFDGLPYISVVGYQSLH